MTKKKGNASKEAAELIARFCDGYAIGDMMVGEAEEIFDRLCDLADEALPCIVNRLESRDADERRAAITLLSELDDPRAITPLRRMLSGPEADEDDKIAIIVALGELGSPVDEATLHRAIPDVDGLLQGAMDHVLEVIEDPAQAEIFLGAMQQQPPEMQAVYVQGFLGELDDRRLLMLFAALLHSEHDEVVLAAVDAIERLKEPAAIPLLEERGQYDPSPQVRHAAGNAALRLQARIGDKMSQPWQIPSPLLVHCLLSTADGDGGQVLLMAREHPEGGLWMLDVMFNDHQGIKDSFTGILDEEELQEMLFAFEPIDFVDVGLERARAEVMRAYQVTLDAGRRLPPPFVMWRSWLEGEDSRAVEEFPLPSLDPARRDEFLAECGDLLDLDEFESWFFNPDQVEEFVPRYRKLCKKGQARLGEPAYEALLDEAIEAVVDEEWQHLLPGRLRRQAWLLAQLYEDDYVSLWALAAAAALEEGVLVEHPLLRGMMDASFFNAAGE
jgi:hypothetical protein